MKIDSSSGNTELSALTDKQNLKLNTSGKTAVSPFIETAGFKQKELLSRSIDSLLKMLKPTDKTQELLRGIINLIPKLPVGGEGLPGNTVDAKLLLHLLKQFRLGKENLLPQKILKEVRFTEKLLEQNLVKDEAVHIYPEDRVFGRPAILINEEGALSESKEDVSKLSLHFDFPNLGPISVVLSREGKKQNCEINCSEKESRNKIRKYHNSLLNQIKKREIRLDSLKIQSRSSFSKIVKGTGYQKIKGLNLWG